MGSETEILCIIALDVLLLRPKRFHILLGRVGRAKAQFEQARRSFKSQFEAELDIVLSASKADDPRQLDGVQ